NRELELAKALYRMETREIGFDRDAALVAAEKLIKIRTEIAHSLPFPATGPAAKRYWFEEKDKGGNTRLMAYSTTPTGKPQLNKDVLARMTKDGVKWAQEF